jgi:L-ascorbate metabolism protein UlaG (beta-lactamase superfamily)
LINFYDTIILNDPVLIERVGIRFFRITYSPGRFTYPALEVDEIPKPDIISLSHAHMDHMDYETLYTITDKYPKKIGCITAYNTADVVAELEWKSLQEIRWNEEKQLKGIIFKDLVVNHFCCRYLWEKNRTKGFMKDGRSFNAIII